MILMQWFLLMTESTKPSFVTDIGTDIDDSTGSISTDTSDTQIPLPCRTTRLSSRRRGMFFYNCTKIQISLGKIKTQNFWPPSNY